MSASQQIMDTLTRLGDRMTAVEDRVKTATASRSTGAIPAGAAPFARKGENLMGSRGFSFAKAIGLACGFFSPEDAKVESEFLGRYRKAMEAGGWICNLPSMPQKCVLAPIAPDFFDSRHVDENLYVEMKSLLDAGVAGGDPDEATWLAKKHLGFKGATAGSPSMSYLDMSAGGGFVPPATWGPPIELLRNKEALMNAGASTIPLGPSGKVTMGRLNAATQGGWAGENFSNNPINPVTGQTTLSAKKVIGLVLMPGELLRYASPAAEIVVRNDLFKTVALIADQGYLEGPGSDTQPLGLATQCFNTSGSLYVAGSAGTPGVSGFGNVVITPTASNTLAPQDFYDFLSGIEENNGEPTAWIMRPRMLRAAQKSRWTPYSGGTSQGGFTFDLTRTASDGAAGARELLGLKAVTTPQVSKKRGNGSQTYVLCLDAADYYIGLFGAIEFTQSDQGWTLVSSDQVLVRAILTTDGAMRHPGLVAGADALGFTVSG